MRILSWNINGIRTLPKYHPWNTFKEFEGILDELNADIICFQELKYSRQALPRDVAMPSNYGSFFSFPTTKGGYSGVAVYARSNTATPLKAEEGLSGKLQPKTPLTTLERISSHYPSVNDIDLFPDEKGKIPASFNALDSEGRGLVLDFGLFVLINVYCPNETSDARTSFKMNYHLLLEERVRILMQEGREVIVLGDMNICATPADHCDGHLPSNANAFWEHPARQWFQKWLHPQGPMIDVVRTYWPERKGMFTCWNTKIQARETNYGTRVDYILVSPGLLKWIKHGDIQPSLKGSDHCPIYIDLYDDITLESGKTLKLCDAMKQSSAARELPRLAARHWAEFKQSRISSFFGKKNETSNSNTRTPSITPSNSQSVSGSPSRVDSDIGIGEMNSEKPATVFNPVNTKKRADSVYLDDSGSSPNKRSKKSSGDRMSSSHSEKTRSAASSSKSGLSSAEAIELENDSGESSSVALLDLTQLDSNDGNYELTTVTHGAIEASSAPTPPSSPSKTAWTNIFTPVQPPKCFVHGEPTKKYTVNKAGRNKGRSFYVCSRPVGPGYDKGKTERLREEVDHKYKCNYFKWASEVKRDNGLSPSPTR
ncbi:Endonuclease/exonuclease/phosphatase [Irpex rosettiformis]|uniref:Endonuclease/exonuclease/phosphatase n=1 Tax=Irpex rosettiformis TaxID=378272 RepID=A0ACB8TUT7_9APHY|nr:Endonuclease/exonuclease/phosphatase [Irpex rosettiformis]